MRQLLLLVIAPLLLTTSVSSAQNSYKWTDEQGRVFYGTKPPANAKKVDAVKGGYVSRYSSKKVIDSFGYKTAAEAEAAQIKESPLPLDGAFLEPGKTDLEYNKGSNDVVRCKVQVRNLGESEATGISASFLFPEGSLVPAVGPVTLAAKSESFYQIAKEQLPVKLKTKVNGKINVQVVLDYDQKLRLSGDKEKGKESSSTEAKKVEGGQ